MRSARRRHARAAWRGPRRLGVGMRRHRSDDLAGSKNVRLGKHAVIAYQRYAHAKQFKRANKSLRRIKTLLGRVERDIARRIKDNEALRDIFRRPLYLAERVREQGSFEVVGNGG